MNSLFAPWRMEFIEKHDSKKGCVLCSIQESKTDSEVYVLARGSHSYVVLNKYPYTHGHLMIVPKRHESDWTSLSREELLEVGEFTQIALTVLRKCFQAEGFNIGVNLGKASGAGIEAHVHQHIVPRWVGDFNFMPLLSEAKVISEHLERTYRRLKESWGSV